MNEQIQKLKKQAFDAVWDLDKTTIGPPTHFVPDGFEQKFAELIVKECIDIAQDRANFPGYPPNDVNDIIDEIREHFGVEQ